MTTRYEGVFLYKPYHSVVNSKVPQQFFDTLYIWLHKYLRMQMISQTRIAKRYDGKRTYNT